MFTKITDADLLNKGNLGMPDTPNLTTAQMQAKLDELSRDVIIPKFNNLVDELTDSSASESIGIIPPENFFGETLKAIIYEIADIVISNMNKAHEHGNKTVIDEITDVDITNLDSLVNLLSGIISVESTVTDSTSQIPNSHAIVDYMTQLGAGDMQKAIYDKNNSGVVDNAEKLGGFEPTWYQKVMDNNLDTDSKTIPGAINELLYELALLNGNVGTIVDLQTVVKSSIVDAINEVIGKIPNMLSTLEEVDANTESGKVADALTLKQVNRNFGGCSLEQEGEDFFIVGADSVRKKLGSGTLEVETNLSKGNNGISVIKGTNVTEYNTCTLRATTLPGNVESPSSIIQSFMKPDGTYENVTLILDTPVDISSYSLWYENFYNGALSVGFVQGFRLVFN